MIVDKSKLKIPCFLTAYEITREYGGPEEGGWYWDNFVPVESILVESEDEAEKEFLRLWDKYGSNAWGKLYSVLGGMEVRICIEDFMAENQTTERPRYE